MPNKIIKKQTSLFQYLLLIPFTFLMGKWAREDIWCMHHTLSLISRFEGYFPKMYICPAGYPTIGYGHVLGNHEIDLIHAELTQHQAFELLKLDLVRGNDIRPYLIDPEALAPHQLDALTSLTYNMGHPDIGYSRLIQHINANKIEEAYDFFAPWRKVEDKIFPGLAKRRLVELMVFANRPFDPKSNLLPSEQWKLPLRYTDESWIVLRELDAGCGTSLLEEAVEIFFEYQKNRTSASVCQYK